MSRRRTPPSSQRERIEYEMEIVCSGRDRHTQRRIDVVTLWPDGAVEVDGTAPVLSTPDGRVAGVTYPFFCPQCHPTRNVPLREDTLRRLADTLKAHDRHMLDISAIHAILNP